jgi:uncharacterized lipoprotein YajG
MKTKLITLLIALTLMAACEKPEDEKPNTRSQARKGMVMRDTINNGKP